MCTVARLQYVRTLELSVQSMLVDIIIAAIEDGRETPLAHMPDLQDMWGLDEDDPEPLRPARMTVKIKRH